MTNNKSHRNASSLTWSRHLATLAILAATVSWNSAGIGTLPGTAGNDRHCPSQRRPLVETRRHLRDLSPQLSGLQQRRHRRPQRHHPAPRLPQKPRRRRHLDRAHVPLAQVDFGYDISDYESVDPKYGTVADMDHLIAEGKQRNIRVILDMVLNHTSDKHQWFIESASSRTNPKHDWYVWNDGVPANGPNVTAYQKRFEHEGRVPPNNWVSGFGGSAWEWVPAVHQFYYHKFYKQQPDLNWRNPAVEKACFDAMRFWLDRGVAGFRLDAIPTLFEDPQLRDEPETGGINAQGDPNLKDIYTSNLPEVHDVIRRMRAMIETYPGDRVLIGETYLPNTAALNDWYGGAKHDELQLPMDMLVGFHGDQRQTRRPQVFANSSTKPRPRSMVLSLSSSSTTMTTCAQWERYGDGVHNQEIARHPR